MKALVKFNNDKSEIVNVNLSYSQGGKHYYDITRNKTNDILDFTPGERQLITADEIKDLRYCMG